MTLRTRLTHRVTILTARCSLMPALVMRVAHALRAWSFVLFECSTRKKISKNQKKIKINQLKHLKGVKIYYSDTDSVYVDKPLPSKLIGTKLGQLKLENAIKFGYFIAPKVYGLVNDKLENIVKVKGLKSDISFYELNVILYKNSTITKYQEKWYRRWDEGKIYIRNEIYSLIVTNNKRQLIYDSCSKLIGTRPYIYVNGTIINKNIDYVYNIKGPTS